MPKASATDTLLVFPPVTEARLFPYLSLPMIAAYLKARGFSVAQLDLNLALCHRFLEKDYLRRYLELNAGAATLKQKYRNALANHLADNLDELKRDVFRRDKRGARKSRPESVRFLTHGVELFLEGSVLKRAFLSLGELDQAVCANDALTSGELALSAQRELVAAALAEHRPRVLAISVAFFSQLFPALLLARQAKELDPNLKVVLGGQQCLLRHGSLVQLEAVNRYVDGLGTGAGEECLEQLLNALAGRGDPLEIADFVPLFAGRRVPNGARARLELDDLPTPDFDGLPLERYLITELQFPLITCVGCYWGKCLFCSYGNRSHRNKSYQQASAAKIARDCLELVSRHGAHRINFADENTNLSLVRAGMKLFREQGGTVEFSTRNRMEPLLAKKEFCRELRELGCVWMSAGYDTNSQRTLDAMRKGIDASLYQSIVDNLHEVGIPLRLSVLGGYPGETEEELRGSEEFLARNASKIAIDVMQMLVLEPTSYLADNPEAEGLKDVDTEKLSGNEVLSYGRGFVGAAYGYAEGAGYQDRLQRMLGMFGRVVPEKNDDVPPDQRARAAGGAATIGELREGSLVELRPWVRLIDGRFVADLLWPKLVELPAGLEPRADGRLVVRAVDRNVEKFVRGVCQADMAEVVLE